jgi:outer membrane protein assembly factor BamB
MDGLLYTLVREISRKRSWKAKRFVCVDAATGEKVWESAFGVYLSDVPDTRVGWSCVVGDPKSKKVFALGVCGYFSCIDAKTGKTLWSHSLHEEYGLLSTYGGRTNMPITYNNLVIISAVIIGWGDMAKPAHRFMAFDQRNGEMVWFNGTRLLPDDTTYSSPVLTSFNGEAAMVFASGDGGVYAFQPETGKQIWSYAVSARGMNATPLVVGDKVICGHDQENLDTTRMGALFCLEGNSQGQIEGPDDGLYWRQTEMFVGKGQPIHVDGKIFALDNPSTTGTLLCVDLETGKLLKEQKLGGPTFASPLFVDGKVYVLTENAAGGCLNRPKRISKSSPAAVCKSGMSMAPRSSRMARCIFPPTKPCTASPTRMRNPPPTNGPHRPRSIPRMPTKFPPRCKSPRWKHCFSPATTGLWRSGCLTRRGHTWARRAN